MEHHHQLGLTSATAPRPDHGESSDLGAHELAGRRATLIAADVPSEQSCFEIVSQAATAVNGLDLLVLNAAYQQYRPGFAEITTPEFERVFRINLFSMIWLLREALQHLDRGASIITTTSIQATQASPGLVDYAMTKAAQVAFTTALADELGPHGIRVNAVAPGPIWTPLIPATAWPEGKLESFGTDTPLGRAGQPAELAAAYVLLASDEGSYISGAVLPVTGGKHF